MDARQEFSQSFESLESCVLQQSKLLSCTLLGTAIRLANGCCRRAGRCHCVTFRQHSILMRNNLSSLLTVALLRQLWRLDFAQLLSGDRWPTHLLVSLLLLVCLINSPGTLDLEGRSRVGWWVNTTLRFFVASRTLRLSWFHWYLRRTGVLAGLLPPPNRELPGTSTP